MSGYGWHPHIESALSLDIWRMVAGGSIRPGRSTSGSWVWTRDSERIAIVGYKAILTDTSGELILGYTHTARDSNDREDVSCRIRLSSIPLHYGGRRWYAHCPYTGRRVRKLYKFSGIAQFCCRNAIRPLPSYASQRDSGSDRINRQRWAIRRKIGDDLSDLFGEPWKPKWMRWRTFNRYAARDDVLAGRDNVYLLRLVGRLMGAGMDGEAKALINGG